MTNLYQVGLVSVIMPVYNSADTVIESIESVFKQKYLDWELIICDDTSQDSSRTLIEEYISSKDDSRIRIVDNINGKGAAGARNSAIEYAQGQYIAFLDSDDIWLDDRLNVQVSFMKMRKISFSYGDYSIFSQDSSKPIGFFCAPATVSFSQLCKTCDIGCLTVMLDRFQLGNVAVQYIGKEDYATWIDLFKKHGILAYKYPGNLAMYRLSRRSLSSNKFNEIIKQYIVLREVAGLSRIKSILNIMHYIINGLRKHYVSYSSIGNYMPCDK